MAGEAKNIEAIKKWVKENRPDIKGIIDRMINSEMVSVLAIGFEAGRAFQKENPDAPDGADAY